MFDKDKLLSAIKDMYINDSYNEYSIDDGYSVVRNDDVDDWRDDGFSILKDGEFVSSYSAESFIHSEEEWVFDKGECIKVMVDYAVKFMEY